MTAPLFRYALTCAAAFAVATPLLAAPGDPRSHAVGDFVVVTAGVGGIYMRRFAGS
jgi:hypothetical protein